MLNPVVVYLRRHHVGLIALVIALGGTAYAGTKISAKQIKPNAVTAKAIKAGAVGTSEIADGTVSSADLGDGSVTGSDTACPAGMTRSGDVCFGPSQGPDDWDSSVADCAGEGLRLPPLDEALLVARALPTPPAGNTDVWSSTTDAGAPIALPGGVGQTFFARKTSGGLLLSGVDDGDGVTHAYHCVSSPGG